MHLFDSFIDLLALDVRITFAFSSPTGMIITEFTASYESWKQHLRRKSQMETVVHIIYLLDNQSQLRILRSWVLLCNQCFFSQCFLPCFGLVLFGWVLFALFWQVYLTSRNVNESLTYYNKKINLYHQNLKLHCPGIK